MCDEWKSGGRKRLWGGYITIDPWFEEIKIVIKQPR